MTKNKQVVKLARELDRVLKKLGVSNSISHGTDPTIDSWEKFVQHYNYVDDPATLDMLEGYLSQLKEELTVWKLTLVMERRVPHTDKYGVGHTKTVQESVAIRFFSSESDSQAFEDGKKLANDIVEHLRKGDKRLFAAELIIMRERAT